MEQLGGIPNSAHNQLGPLDCLVQLSTVMLNTLIHCYKQPIKGCLNFDHFNLKVANIYNVNMFRSYSTELLQSMILSRNKIYSWKPPVLLFGLRRLKTCLRGFRLIRLDKNWPAQSQKLRVMAYSNLSNHTFQVVNNKRIDQTARLTFVVHTCRWPRGFLTTGAQILKWGT